MTSVHSTGISIAHPPQYTLSQLELNLKSLSSKSSSLIDLLLRKKKKGVLRSLRFRTHQTRFRRGRITYFFFLSFFFLHTIQKIFNSQPPFAGSEDHVWKNFSLVTLSFSFLSFLFLFLWQAWFVTVTIELEPRIRASTAAGTHASLPPHSSSSSSSSFFSVYFLRGFPSSFFIYKNAKMTF